MDFSSFSSVFKWIIAHGYLLMFSITLVEGPVITAAGAFAAKLGYFNIYAIFLISILGNLIPDIIYYAVGFWGRIGLVDRYGPHFKLSKERIARIEQLMEKHAGKTMLVVKLVPFLAVPGLMIAGASRVPIKKYVYLSALIILPSSAAFLLLGYYMGSAYNRLGAYADYAGYFMVGAIVVFILVSYIWKRASLKLSSKIEKL